MVRKLAAVFLLSVLMVTFLAVSLSLGADKPIHRFVDRASFPARFAPIYGFSGAEQGTYAAPKSNEISALGQASSNAVGRQIGSTAYDYQHNCSEGHQVEHRGTLSLHFDWMAQVGYVLGTGRGVDAQSYDLSDCSFYFSSPKRITVDYGGYVCMDAAQNGCAIPAAHEGPDSDNQRPRAYWDYCAGGPLGTFGTDFPTDVWGWYQHNGTGPGDQNIWPIIEWQPGTETVLHMVACESGGAAGDPQTISYYRRVGGYGTDVGTWSAQKVIDTVMNINPVLAASQTTGKVAVVWNAPANYRRAGGFDVEYGSQYANDVWYAISTDQGASFMGVTGSLGHAVEMGTIPGANITQYDPMSDWKAYCDMGALITADENLHIVWGCRKWTDTTTLYRRQSAIFHWSQDVTNIRTVARATWDTGGTCYGHAWGSDVAKMSLAECDSKLYVLFTQFGNALAPCFDYTANKKVVNGELFMTVSNNKGLNWDRPQNLTNSPSHLCADGSCNSDYWATMARYGRTEATGCEGVAVGAKVLDILYINDKSAGGVVQGESGIWTTNPVMWLVTPCRAVVEEPGYADNAGTGYGECYSDVPLVLKPNGDTAITFTMENPGLRENDYSIAVNYTNGANWIALSTTAGTISAGLINTQDVEMTISAPTDAPDPSTWVANIVITHEAEGSPRTIPLCLLVASNFVYPNYANLETSCIKVRVYSTGEMVRNAENAAMDFIQDCDTFNPNTNSAIYLYDASPIICQINGDGDTVRYTMYSKNFTDADGLRPLESLQVDNSNAAYTYAWGEYCTPDSTLGFRSQYFTPKLLADSCSFMIVVQWMWNRTGTTIDSVLYGDVFDWDIPSDSGSNNGSGVLVTDSFGAIYQFGGEYNQDDSTEDFCAQESNTRIGMVLLDNNHHPVRNAFTVDNATYIYSTGPYSSAAPLPPAPMYRLMKEREGYSTWDSADPDSTYTDLSTVVTYGQYNLASTDTVIVVKALYTAKDAPALTRDDNWIREIIRFIMRWMHQYIHPLLPDWWLTSGGCCDTPGDANNDVTVNVGDAVFIINYVFKGGDLPACMQEADANADATINVGDAVFIINYVFKGGDAPVCGP